MNSAYGKNINLRLFGGSHEDCVGMILEGIPAGIALDMAALQRFLDRRAPGRSPWASARREEDRPRFLSGVKNGVTDGRPIAAVIENHDARPEDYSPSVPRPGHADYTARVKDGRIAPGGGRFSGRMTAPLCIAGGICLQLLEKQDVSVLSRIASIGVIEDSGELNIPTAEKTFPTVDEGRGQAMIEQILRARAEGDSLGGVIECAVMGLSAGVGGPLLDGLESRIADLVFSIPAVKAIEFGDGFAAARKRGSENNDPYAVENGGIQILSNHAGGILGGISTGQPLRFRAAVKPTPSIAKPQRSVDLDTMTPVTLSVSGRHDPCIVPRAVPCVEAAAAIALWDALSDPTECGNTLARARAEIDQLDREMLALFHRRMALAEEIADCKKEQGLAISDEQRETEKLLTLAARSPEGSQGDTEELFRGLMALSRRRQERRMSREDF